MLWYCKGCTSAYAVGLAKCPQCGRPSPQAQGEPAPAKTAGEPAKAGGGDAGAKRKKGS